MSSTDYLGLNDHKIFKTVRETLPKNIQKTQNLLTVKDDTLYTWDFQDNCVLTLNVKAHARNGEGISHQTLFPNYPLLFTPELLTVNSSSTLLVVAGPNGVLVLELPSRTFPYSKEVVYCRSYSLDERILSSGGNVEVCQVKFHPGSPADNHILVLTCDNFLRLYTIFNGEAITVAKYPLGEHPVSFMPGSKTYFLSALGETAVDFDFALPELERSKKPLYETDLSITHSSDKSEEKLKQITYEVQQLKVAESNDFNENVMKKNLKNYKIKEEELQWPIYILYGNADVSMLTINLTEKSKPKVKGPMRILPSKEISTKYDACSIICLKTVPTVICMAFTRGSIYHMIALPETKQIEKEHTDRNLRKWFSLPDKALYIFETIELELGLATTDDYDEYCCSIFLHLDESRNDRYFATHDTGVHSVIISSIYNLQKFVSGADDDSLLYDILKEASCAEYLLCTKTTSSENINPVIGFSLYYDPPSMFALLSNGQLVDLSLESFGFIPSYDTIDYEGIDNMDSPLKKMLKEPFDVYIQKILKQAKTQPIMKVSSGGQHTQQECYELLQRAAQVFRDEHFKHYQRALEEIEKRVKTLQMLKDYQKKEIERMNKERLVLQEKATNLAEKYEDFMDKQEELTKRCQRLLFLISQKRSEPSDAERNFKEELGKAKEDMELYKKAIERLKRHQLQIESWKKQNIQKESGLGSIQSQTIKANLQDTTNQIAAMVKEVNEYKKILGIK